MVALPLWLNALILALAAVTGWRLALAKLRQIPDLTVDNAVAKLPVLFSAIGLAVILMVPILLLGYYYQRLLWFLPFWLQYWSAGLVWAFYAAAFMFVGAFVLTLAFRTGHRQRKGLVVLMITGLAAFLVSQDMFTSSIAGKLTDDILPDGTVLQTSGVSCAAASGANVARLLGQRQVREAEVALAMGTSRSGTSMPQVVVGMRAFGIECTPVALQAGEIDRLTTPAILFVDHPATGPEGHAMVLIKREADGRFRVIDPLYGRDLWPRTKLESVWHGLAVGCRRQVVEQ